MSQAKVEVFIFTEGNRLGQEFIQPNLWRLPKSRSEKCQQYRQTLDQANCIISYLLLAYGLKSVYGIDDVGEFKFNDYGKPYLALYPDIYFNLSHCQNAVACALGLVELGIDVQDYRQVNSQVAARVCTKTELLEIERSRTPLRLFAKYWARREAYAKCLGVSVAQFLNQPIPTANLWEHSTPNFQLAVYCRDAHPEVTLNQISIDNLI